MKKFLDENFLLEIKTAEMLYHEHANVDERATCKKVSYSSKGKPCSSAKASPLLTAYPRAGCVIPRCLAHSVKPYPSSLTAQWHDNPPARAFAFSLLLQ